MGGFLGRTYSRFQFKIFVTASLHALLKTNMFGFDLEVKLDQSFWMFKCRVRPSGSFFIQLPEVGKQWQEGMLSAAVREGALLQPLVFVD